MPAAIDLDDNDHLLQVSYTGTDGKKYTIEDDCVAAHDFLADIGVQYPDAFEKRHEIDNEIREWAVRHGGDNMPASMLLLLTGAIRKAFEEFKKKADQTLISQIFMDSTPSILDQVKSGHLKLASQESLPSENSEQDKPPQTLPPSVSTG